MKVPFSDLPGRHERHFRRKLRNPLFPHPIDDYSNEDLLKVQHQDHEELVAFIEELKQLIVKATQLPPNVDSGVILSLKEELDKAYETSAGLADDQTGNQFAIKKLTEVIMAAVTKGAAGDNHAAMELEQEEEARKSHYALLEHALIADLLHPESVIKEDELTPTLLCEDEDGLNAALTLFDRDQLSEIVSQGHQLLSTQEKESDAPNRLDQMEKHLTSLAG